MLLKQTNPISSVFICVPFGKAKRLHLWFQLLKKGLRATELFIKSDRSFFPTSTLDLNFLQLELGVSLGVLGESGGELYFSGVIRESGGKLSF